MIDLSSPGFVISNTTWVKTNMDNFDCATHVEFWFEFILLFDLINFVLCIALVALHVELGGRTLLMAW